MSEQDIIKNPVELYLEWEAGFDIDIESKEETGGRLFFYNKSEMARQYVPLPFRFLVLDEYYGFFGWDKDKKQIFSNEYHYEHCPIVEIIKRLGNDQYEPIIGGYYKEVKKKVKEDSRFSNTAIIYCITDKLKPFSIKFKKSNHTSWVEFKKQLNRDEINKTWIELVGRKKDSSGNIKWWNPVFNKGDEIKGDFLKQYQEIKNHLWNDYHEKYFAEKKQHLLSKYKVDLNEITSSVTIDTSDYF